MRIIEAMVSQEFPGLDDLGCRYSSCTSGRAKNRSGVDPLQSDSVRASAAIRVPLSGAADNCTEIPLAMAKISFVSPSTRTLMKPWVSLNSLARLTCFIGRYPRAHGDPTHRIRTLQPDFDHWAAPVQVTIRDHDGNVDIVGIERPREDLVALP